jgi:hypothetical protein
MKVQDMETGRQGDWESARNASFSLSPHLLVSLSVLQHRQSAAEAFGAQALVKLALLGFVAAVDDDLVKLERAGSRLTPFRTWRRDIARRWLVIR